MTPEQKAKVSIDALLVAAGWFVCNVADANIHAETGEVQGVAIREFPLNSGFGFADNLLYVNGKACGVIEAMLLPTTTTSLARNTSSKHLQSNQLATNARVVNLRDHWQADIFPARIKLPKTLIFAKGHKHATRSDQAIVNSSPRITTQRRHHGSRWKSPLKCCGLCGCSTNFPFHSSSLLSHRLHEKPRRI